MPENIDKEIARDITVAIIQKAQLITHTAAKPLTADQAIEKNGEAIAKLFKRVYEEVSNIN